MDPAQQPSVRPADRKDVDSIVKFSAAMAWETEHRRLDEARLRQGTLSLFNSPSLGFFLVAEVRDSDRSLVIGQLMITYEWSDWRNGVFWWIQSVYVDPAWRRQGIFRRLLETVMASAKADPDVCGVRLYVEQNNQAAQMVYQRLGLSASGYKVYERDFVLTPGSAPGTSS